MISTKVMSKALVDRSIAVGLLLAGLLTRPALLGQNYAPYSLILASLIFLFYLLFYSPIISRKNFLILFVVGLLWVFVLSHTLLMGGVNDNAIKAFILILAGMGIFAILLSNKNIEYLFFRFFVIFIIFQCFSYIITFFLSINNSITHLQIISLSVEGYPGAGQIVFPLTSIYGTINIFNKEIPRLAAGFRESGVTQAFISWAYFSLPLVKLDKIGYKIILILGLIGTLSTLAIPLFLFLLVELWVLKKHPSIFNIVLGIIFTSIMLYLAFIIAINIPGIGVRAKLSSPSISARMEVTKNALISLNEHPFGTGAFISSTELAGVNLISWSKQIGIIGVLIILILYLVVINKEGYHYRKVVLLSAFLLTWLISQPLYDSPLLYILLVQSVNTKPGKIKIDQEQEVNTKITVHNALNI